MQGGSRYQPLCNTRISVCIVHQKRRRCQAHTCEEIDSLVSDQIAGEILRQVDTRNDERAAKICTLEELRIGRTLRAALHVNHTAHHSDSLVSHCFGFTPKSIDRLGCFF